MEEVAEIDALALLKAKISRLEHVAICTKTTLGVRCMGQGVTELYNIIMYITSKMAPIQTIFSVQISLTRKFCEVVLVSGLLLYMESAWKYLMTCRILSLGLRFEGANMGVWRLPTFFFHISNGQDSNYQVLDFSWRMSLGLTGSAELLLT